MSRCSKMIKIILGGIGSGKSLTSVREILYRNSDVVYGNFKVKNCDNFTRLKYSDVLLKNDKEKPEGVNWTFWDEARKKHGGFHIILDEIHNIMHSRRSMSKENIIISKWVSQIRKVTGENENYDLFCISQAIDRIDVSIRDLAAEIIFCTKVVHPSKNVWTDVINDKGKIIKKLLPLTLIYTTFFRGTECVNNFKKWKILRAKTYWKRSYFAANNYYKYYDSYEFIKFGDDNEYL